MTAARRLISASWGNSAGEDNTALLPARVGLEVVMIGGCPLAGIGWPSLGGGEMSSLMAAYPFKVPGTLKDPTRITRGITWLNSRGSPGDRRPLAFPCQPPAKGKGEGLGEGAGCMTPGSLP